MTKPKSGLIHQRPAPYINSMAALLSTSHGNNHTVFYRAGNTELFATGSFSVIQKGWPISSYSEELLPVLREMDSSRCALGGYLSYEAGFAFESRWNHLTTPKSGHALRFFEAPCWYEVQHATQKGRLVYIDDCPSEALKTLSDCLDTAALVENSPVITASESLSFEALAQYGEFNEQTYSSVIERVLEDIRAGRYYELNFTQRFLCQSFKSPHTVFATLLEKLRPSRGFYCDFGDEIICGLSPELFLKKVQDTISTSPIKGSYNSDTDKSLNGKLQAEHIMVVDLARNDFGRVSDKAWVSVQELGVVKEFGSINHLESLITGKTSKSWLELLPSIYPAASITGAPKVEVVQAINEYEGSSRGVYTGTCGWIWPNGNVDLNVGIRTLVARGDKRNWGYELGAGGAIVADSTAEEEYRECINKARPFLEALLQPE